MHWYYYTVFAVIVVFVPVDHVWSSDPICPNKTMMEKCVRDAENDWEIDRNKKNTDDKDWCCHQWQAYDCQLDLGQKCKLGSWDRQKHNASMNAIKNDLNKVCKDWPDDKCSGLKWWAITLIVIGSLLAVALVGFLVFVLLARRRSNRRYSAAAK